MALNLEILRGSAMAQLLPALADLRIRVFREFPYLYDGSAAYEQRYLQKYVESDASVMVVVRDGDAIVGASSGLPLENEAQEMRAPFEKAGLDVDHVFYCGESVLLPEYRGQGLGVRFFEEREAHAIALKKFTSIAFCAVERPQDHPRRPRDYQPLDAFWTRRGYYKQPALRTEYHWQDLDEDAETPKPMVFWLKALPHV